MCPGQGTINSILRMIWITIRHLDPDYDPHLIKIARIVMKFLPEVSLGPMSNSLDFGDYTDYNQDPD